MFRIRASSCLMAGHKRRLTGALPSVPSPSCQHVFCDVTSSDRLTSMLSSEPGRGVVVQCGRAPWRPSPPGTLLGQDSPRFPAAHPAEIAEWRETEATVNAAVVQEGVGGVMKALQGSFEGLFQVSYHALVKETKQRTGVVGLISHKTFRGGCFQGKIGSVTPQSCGLSSLPGDAAPARHYPIGDTAIQGVALGVLTARLSAPKLRPGGFTTRKEAPTTYSRKVV